MADDKIHYLVLNTGYVESSSIGSLIIEHSKGFDTVEEAVLDFSKILMHVYRMREGHGKHGIKFLKDCCKNAYKVSKDSNFCATCGSQLVTKEEKVTFEDLIGYVDEIKSASLDSWAGSTHLGYDELETYERAGWRIPASFRSVGKMAVIENFHPVLEIEDQDGQKYEEIQGWCNQYHITKSSISIGQQKNFNLKNAKPSTVLKAPKLPIFENDDDDDADEDFDYKIVSDNLTDYIFTLSFDPYKLDMSKNEAFVAYVTPSNFFYEEGYMYDQHLPIEIPGWFEESEGIFAPEKQDTKEALKNQLIALGLEWSEDFDEFINPGKNETYVSAPTTIAKSTLMQPTFTDVRTVTEVSPGVYQTSSSFSIFAAGAALMAIGGKSCPNVPPLPIGKIGTDECKKLIVDLIKVNPGMVAKEFTGDGKQEEMLASIEKNWVRTGKRKDGKNNVRDFDCKPLDDQLRAYVTDNGTNVIRVEIQGE